MWVVFSTFQHRGLSMFRACQIPTGNVYVYIYICIYIYVYIYMYIYNYVYIYLPSLPLSEPPRLGEPSKLAIAPENFRVDGA
jgi:hypothetical protein